MSMRAQKGKGRGSAVKVEIVCEGVRKGHLWENKRQPPNRQIFRKKKKGDPEKTWNSGASPRNPRAQKGKGERPGRPKNPEEGTGRERSKIRKKVCEIRFEETETETGHTSTILPKSQKKVARKSC